MKDKITGLKINKWEKYGNPKLDYSKSGVVKDGLRIPAPSNFYDPRKK